MSKIVIIDYGVGNVLSIQRAFEFHKTNIVLSNNHKEILSASKIILPGVGAFSSAMKKLNEQNLINVLKELNYRNVPILGICLGMQLLFEKSFEYGEHKGLSFIPGEVVSLSGKNIKVPHIGWSNLNMYKNNFKNNLLKNVTKSDYFYFIHSYYSICKNNENLLGTVSYGNELITAFVQKNNIFGCQFHPEKSGNTGLKIIKNYIEL